MDASEGPAGMQDVELRVLGPLEVWAAGSRRALPRSKKARALLAYLATTARPHRRERLCSLLWDVTDDPRGALRWTLSRLRQVFDEDRSPIEADRESVVFHAQAARVDAQRMSDALRRGIAQASTAELEALADLPRGEFLEGLDLPDFMDWNAWVIAERERFREAHCAVLTELVRRRRERPELALPHARKRAQLDSFDVATQTDLLALLLAAGKTEEARMRVASLRSLYRQMGAAGFAELELAWHSMLGAPAAPPSAPPAPAVAAPTPAPPVRPFTGRQAELERLEGLLRQAQTDSRVRLALLTGEPGSGKSRLAERLASRAQSAGLGMRSGRAFEAEGTRPYGPWVDALELDLRALMSGGGDADAAGSRDALFGAVAARVAEAAERQRGLLLVLDDLQWLDSDSAELLHFVARRCASAPLFILLLARAGELGDNAAATRTLRGIRREAELVEFELPPLSRDDIAALVANEGGIDVDGIHEASAGNPLYAIELARAAGAGGQSAPPTLPQLIRERVEQLPEHAADVLRWAAVLGHAIDVERLEAVSSLAPDELVDGLERLEHHALLRIDTTRVKQRYTFSHDVVREAVYGELSQPRRRLMHRKVAQLLEPQIANAQIATEVAHHAGLAGEALLGVRACAVAGQQSLRVFANGDAEALARRGLRLAEQLEGGEHVTAALDLLHLQFSARTPDRERAAAKVRELAERALDLGLTHAARLGFQMLSFLRWESASLADAHDNIMQAERVTRSAGPEERTKALAEAARCLVLLERNIGQAEAFVMEAGALADRAGRESAAVAFASGMIAAHRGELQAAVDAFREARELARDAGERLSEFRALQHWVMLELDRADHAAAARLAEPLVELGQRVRAGAEAPTGRALLALSRIATGTPDAAEPLREALAELRELDAKYELTFLLTRWASHELTENRPAEAAKLAADALEVARAIGRASDQALALAVLAESRKGTQAAATRAAYVQELRSLSSGDLSALARARSQGVAATTAARGGSRKKR